VDTIFDTFEVTPADSFADGDAPRLEAGLREALSGDLTRLRPSRRVIPRQLRHFRFAPRIEFRDVTDGDTTSTRFSLVAPDRPGLLADVAFVLRNQRLRVHDARIATFGERAEDMFVISDEHDHALTESARQQLQDAMLACLDPDRKAGDPH
ncbi:MAG TPA: bifunctional uridylyltransferase/uridylyl-removing protein, partial [Stenotrophomonas sp.]|nr:bifunctional uridylyltransferase/uridylyl-removing protein [Stenotrophomonas sp.]